MVANMTDIFLLLVAPAGGDELQGVKRGIMEIADMIVVNKADGDLAAAANRTRADYAGALRLMRRRAGDPEGVPCALAVSALLEAGLDVVWTTIQQLDSWHREQGCRRRRRAEQAVHWLKSEIDAGLIEAFQTHPAVMAALPGLERQVAAGEVSPDVAAADILMAFRGRVTPPLWLNKQESHGMSYSSLRDFMDRLERDGQLVRVTEQVSDRS